MASITLVWTVWISPGDMDGQLRPRHKATILQTQRLPSRRSDIRCQVGIISNHCCSQPDIMTMRYLAAYPRKKSSKIAVRNIHKKIAALRHEPPFSLHKGRFVVFTRQASFNSLRFQRPKWATFIILETQGSLLRIQTTPFIPETRGGTKCQDRNSTKQAPVMANIDADKGFCFQNLLSLARQNLARLHRGPFRVPKPATSIESRTVRRALEQRDRFQRCPCLFKHLFIKRS